MELKPRVNTPCEMSDATEPVIHTIGSIDKHDTKLGDDSPGSKQDISSRVDNRLNNSEDRAGKVTGEAVMGSGTPEDSADAHTLSEPGVVGKVQTVGTADPAGRDATAREK